ncbi:MAG: hypothetical protein IBJ11_06020, partial [Phycisphaerales bacterium]|nr:hypothetical protein [Phycisphaerales bacterium]
MFSKPRLGWCLAASLLWTPAVLAQSAGTTSPAPATPEQPTGAPKESLNQAVVVAVQGRVLVEVPGAARAVATVGQVLPMGTKIITGPRHWIQLRIGGAQIITVDRVGIATLDKMQAVNGVDVTEVGMQHGRVLFNVTSTQFANDVTIKAPDATLAIKGTQGGLEVTAGQPTRAYGLDENQGTVEVLFSNGRLGIFNDNSTVTAERPNAVDEGEYRRFTDITGSGARDGGDEISASQRSSGGGNAINTQLGLGTTGLRPTTDLGGNPTPPPPP